MTLNISGIIVHAVPEKISEVRDVLSAIPGVEVHGATELGKMVVTLEKHGDQETADTFQHISQLPGVLSTAMVYHHFEPEENLIS